VPSKLATATVPAYRDFDATVAAVAVLSPHFVRVTFTGHDLELFGDTCLDQRIKVVLPLRDAGGTDPFADLPRGEDWYAAWRALPRERQNPFRTYTVRAVRPGRREVDVDFVRHGDGGPASAWAARVEVGHRCVLIGPDRRGDSALVGVEWRPGAATEVLLAGDETAVPAIGSILESLPADTRGQAFLEVPTAEDVLPLEAPDGIEVRWLPRVAGMDAAVPPHGARLAQVLRAELTVGPAHPGVADPEPVDVDGEPLWETPVEEPEGAAFAWLAGEATVIRSLRRHLVRDRGWDRRNVAFMGYWRLGRAEV
jgi:NADPH-dependent ferric siderophore reductase